MVRVMYFIVNADPGFFTKPIWENQAVMKTQTRTNNKPTKQNFSKVTGGLTLIIYCGTKLCKKDYHDCGVSFLALSSF